MKPHPSRRRPEPYFKVQTRDPIALTWRDERREAFATLAEALAFVESGSAGKGPVRIVEFHAGRSKIAHEQR
jgi:hypothetical protein